MLKLNVNQIESVIHLFRSIEGALWFVEQVKSGHGSIFVNDENDFKTAFMTTDSSEYFFVGEYKEPFLIEAITYIKQQIIPHHNEPIGFFYFDSNQWQQALLDKLADYEDPRYSRYLTRQYYRLNVPYYQSLKKTRNLLDPMYQMSIEKENTLSAKVYYQSIEIAHAIDNGQALGVMDIDVYTHPEHRKQGLALLTTTTLIDHCLEKGIIPQWGCWTVNEASVSLAKKLGFQIASEVKVIFANFEEFINR